MKNDVQWLRVNKRRRCPQCGRADNCKVSADGARAYCRRVAAGAVHTGRDGGHLHVLIETDGDRKTTPQPMSPVVPITTATVKQRTPDDLHAVYSEFLRCLEISNDHTFELKSRGLDLTDIHLHGYKTMPATIYSKTICRRLARSFDLAHVPGFYYRNFTWHFVDYFGATGFLIPIRNAEHRIVGLQLRRDDDQKPKYMMMSSSDKPRGASSGTPPHFAYLGIPGAPSFFREVIVTEGALKANIIATYTNTPTVGLVGVGCFDESFGQKLRGAFPNLETVKIAFDMDARTNPNVRCQRDRLVLTLQKINLRTEILSWNPVYKGLDDYLVNKNDQKQFAA